MMSLFRDTLVRRLAPVAALAGFVPADRAGPEADSVDGIEHVEYRLDLAERRVLLDLCRITARRTVSAVLWSPADVAGADADAGIDRIALRERTWRDDAEADPNALAAEIVAEVAAWLADAPWRRAAS